MEDGLELMKEDSSYILLDNRRTEYILGAINIPYESIGIEVIAELAISLHGVIAQGKSKNKSENIQWCLDKGGKTTWSKRSIETILTNDKYVGDVIIYKSFSFNFPKKKRIQNNGEHKKYIQ